MPTNDFQKRIDDLAERCDRTQSVTATAFLTPAERYELRSYVSGRPELRLVLTGGQDGCERQRAFFLPDWLDGGDFDADEYIRAVRVEAFFGEPGHRDYMGAALGLGIRREWLGDIRVHGSVAYIFCVPSVISPLLDDLDKVGRCGVRTSPCALSDVPAPERRVKKLSFTLKSPRLDAAAGAMFGLSRTAAAELIRMGAATLNYAECAHVDAAVGEGDVISLRCHGKGVVTAVGGRSRKDRLFVEAEILL